MTGVVPSSIADSASYALLIWGLVNAFKKQWPRLGGLWVWGTAFGFGYFLAFLIASDPHAVRAWLLQGLLFSCGALGIDGGLHRLALIRSQTIMPPAAADTPMPNVPRAPAPPNLEGS